MNRIVTMINIHGEMNPFYGKKHTEEAKEKNRQKHIKRGL